MGNLDISQKGMNFSLLTTEDYLFLSDLRKQVVINMVHAIYAEDINEAFTRQENILRGEKWNSVRIKTQEKLRQWWDSKNTIDGIFGDIEDAIFPIIQQLQSYSSKEGDQIDPDYEIVFDLGQLNPNNFTPDYPSELSLRGTYIDERICDFLQDNKGIIGSIPDILRERLYWYLKLQDSSDISGFETWNPSDRIFYGMILEYYMLGAKGEKKGQEVIYHRMKKIQDKANERKLLISRYDSVTRWNEVSKGKKEKEGGENHGSFGYWGFPIHSVSGIRSI